MKKLFLILISFLGLTVAHGQITFQKTYGGANNDDLGYSVQQTNDGGFIITGSTSDIVASINNIYLVKTSFDGTLLWTKTFNGGGGIGYSVQQTNDGGFIIAGSGYGDVYLLKTDSDGSLQWSKTYGGTKFDEGKSVQQTSDGGFIVTGWTQSFGAGSSDIYLVKTASDGTLQWTKIFGGAALEEGYSVQQTNDGGFIIAGTTSSFVTAWSDVYLVKTTSDGTLQWAKTFGGSGGYESGNSVQQTNDGGFIMTGYTSSFGAGNSYLVKTASDGTLQWTKIFGGKGTAFGNSVQETNSGGFIITGRTADLLIPIDDVFVAKTDSDGTPQWVKTFGGGIIDDGYAVQKTNDGGFIICGSTDSFGTGGYDIYLIKTDSNGNSGCNETSLNPNATSGGVQGTGGGIQGAGGTSGNPATQTSSGGIATTLCFANGITEIALEDLINVFPNPFSTQTVLQSGIYLHNATFAVDNCFGQTVVQIKNINGQTVVFSRDNLASGLYFFRLTENNKLLAVDKLVITDK